MTRDITEVDFKLFGRPWWLTFAILKTEFLTFLAILGVIEIALLIGG